MNQKINWNRAPLFVGTVTTRRGLKLLTARIPEVDLIEVRLDALLAKGVDLENILDSLRRRKNPVLLTLRLPEEGGLYPWAIGERSALFTALLPDVDSIDVELAAIQELAPILALAKRSKTPVVLSAHSIHLPVALVTLKKWTAALRRARPEVAKIAVHVGDRADLAALARILLQDGRQKWAVMGLGPQGTLSRVVLGALGSTFLYGYLDAPAAPGQPSVKKLRSSGLG